MVLLIGSLPGLDMSPATPLNDAGILTEPSISFPIPIGDILAATIAP
jgi:hypothetical protein